MIIFMEVQSISHLEFTVLWPTDNMCKIHHIQI